ncbi:MAG: DNA gyrase subunit A [Anaerolineae bacterium]|nr:DNA gyrase subunit A [Anaerolineae bacterium]MBT7073845.1 DNA gyrase subunit A [Anaerolineae bacterium]MBT7783099.1 DNA gyrase subunit A [Anaerolineae bacterium]
MEAGDIKEIDINEEMRSSYLDYAMSVIVARALPDARDGLKPVHRRILYAMHDMGIRATGSHKKSARIVGEVLGKYHPHGDSAVYESMARMAQPFSLRYMLVDGQGNFGSIDGDSPAAMRYTEARMGKLAEEMLVDINKETVNFTPNFDDSLEEPDVLPSRLPNLLLNGASGIAVGMATNIPPHNLNELTDALVYMIDNYDNTDEIGIDKLMEFIPGPDFPTGGIIVGQEGIIQAYSTGRGRVIMRGKAHVEEMRANRFRIVITEIPYQLNKTTLIERIASMARNGKIDSISDLRDESDRRGMSIVIELKRSAQPKKVLNQLYKHTSLQATFGVQMLALVNKEPKLLSLKRALLHFVEHRKEVITRRTEFDLKKARARAHILDGLIIALDNIDAVIETIRASADVNVAKDNLMKRFKLSELQAQAILDMQLRRLAALERWKIEEEHKELMAKIAYYEDLLAHSEKILEIIKEDLLELAEKYGDKRRTHIAIGASGSLNEEDLVEDEAVLVTITERGYIKRVLAKTFRTQGRGGRGIKGHTTKDKDEVIMMIPARTLDTILFFTDKGKVYSEKTYQIPEASRIGKGISIVNILDLEADEKITAAIPVPDFDEASFCTLATVNGRIKRVELSEFASVRPSGLIAMGLNGDDKLGWARLTSGDDDIIIVTELGKALRYKEDKVRAMGRPAAGVIAINLLNGDKVTTMDVVEPNGTLLTVTETGIGKQTPLEEYSPKGRATQGVLTMDKNAIAEIGKIVAARVVQQEDHLTLISTEGVIIRLKVEEVKTAGRATRGVHLMRTKDGDTVAAVARIAAKDLKQVGAKLEEEKEDEQKELL